MVFLCFGCNDVTKNKKNILKKELVFPLSRNFANASANKGHEKNQDEELPCDYFHIHRLLFNGINYPSFFVLESLFAFTNIQVSDGSSSGSFILYCDLQIKFVHRPKLE